MKVGGRKWNLLQTTILKIALRERGIPQREGVTGLIRYNRNSAELLDALAQSNLEVMQARLDAIHIHANLSRAADLPLDTERIFRILEWNPLSDHQPNPLETP